MCWFKEESEDALSLLRNVHKRGYTHEGRPGYPPRNDKCPEGRGLLVPGTNPVVINID